MDFKQKLKRLAHDANLSTREVAERVKVGSHSTVNRWLTGEADPRLSELVRIAEAFGVTVAYLADETVDDPKAGVAALSDAERKMIEKGRTLGVGQAVALLESAGAIGGGPAAQALTMIKLQGVDLAFSRLMALPANTQR
jgi:transcriptional regulator with XRE-family HTH domain